MSQKSGGLHEFGPFSVDPVERRLLRDGAVTPLTPKAFDLLLILLESRGRLLTREDLMEQLWPGTFVEEANLSQNIAMLRRALGERSGDRQYIETVPKQGY